MSSKETAEAILIVLRKVGKWIALSALALVSIFLGFYAYTQIEEHYKNRPQIVMSLKGIELEMKFQEFMFRHEGFVLDVVKNKDAKDITYYKNKEKFTTVGINNSKVVYVSFSCSEGYEYTSVNGISCDTSGDIVLDKYENSIRVQCLKNKNDENYLRLRIYDSEKFGIRHYLLSNKVLAFVIASPAELSNNESFINRNWTACE